MERKNFLSSKRFWIGLLGILTGLSLILTGEKTFSDSQFVGELILTAIGFIQTIIALTSKDIVVVSRVNWENRKIQ